MNARKMGQFLLNAACQAESAVQPGLPVSGIRRYAGISPHGLAWAAVMSTEGETGCS